MGIEIERRFIVKGEEWKDLIEGSQELKQSYLTTDPNGWTIRIRIIDEKVSQLTLKYPQKGISRFEFEYSIPLNDAKKIWELSKTQLSKTRYQVIYDKRLWVIDCFKDKNFPLVIAEIELSSINEVFKKPSWCNQEISNLNEWSNAALAKTPISKWPIKQRLEN